MSFERPSLNQIFERIKSDVKTGLSITTILSRSFVGVFAKAFAGTSHVLHGHVEFIFKQLFPDTAEKQYLDRHSSIYNVTRSQAVYTHVQAIFTGTNGRTIPAGTELQSDTGNKYIVELDVIISSETALVSAIAIESGAKTNLSNSDPLKLVSAISGVNSEGSIFSTLITGYGQELDDSLRARLMDRIQRPPSGGNANDYIQKLLEDASISRAWVFPNINGPGTVAVKFVQDSETSIIPLQAKIDEIQSIVDIWAPVTADVTVSGPAILALDMVIKISPNSIEIQTAIEEELKDLIIRAGQVSGAYATPTTTYDGKILLSKINEAISIALGEEDHEVVSILGVAPANVVPAVNELIIPGTIVWQSI